MKKILLFFLFIQSIVFAQQSNLKDVKAVRNNGKIVIDGVLSDEAWKNATSFNNFVEWRPSFGKVEDVNNRTEIYLIYNDDAFYIGGHCYETNTDSISKELVGRDAVGVNDFAGIIFDTYNDKINGFGYYVTPLGEQFDAKYSSNGEDPSWNSVYETHSKIVKDGWTFEMRIPYAAIRFVAKPNQTWGVNITRKRVKSGKQLMWNPVNPAVGGSFLAQFGLLKEINNIKPPVRLSFSPYLSFNLNNYPYNNPNQKNTTTRINGGMDVKYGINQAFTLDMTLVPDFGQVQSDNIIQNLGPFEVKYNEYRSFFTEGTELFGKGNLFYSRRIGGMPVNFNDASNNLSANDSIIKNPVETKLINATKISGRTKKGLGIGVLNAITAPQYATILDKSKGETRDVETSPLTNYNIFVLDQTLKNNSSVSLINTSVIRSGETYDANVTAALWDFYDKKNLWNFNGKFGVSNLMGYESLNKTTTGLNYALGFGKVGGRFNFNIWQELCNDKFQQNDLGYFTNNNFFDNGLWAAYKWLEPKKWYNRIQLNYNFWYSMRAKPFDYQNVGMNINGNAQLKSLWSIGANVWFNPKSNDFYEPRMNTSDNYVFKRPANLGVGFWIYTNESKKYSSGVEWYFACRPSLKGFGHSLSVSNQYRFNNKLTINLKNFLDITNNGIGFAFKDSTINSNGNLLPHIGLRQGAVIENTFLIKYNFSNKMGLTFRTRHYWSKVSYEDIKQLQKDGSTIESNSLKTGNINFNAFNVDMTYTWQFALGSFINFNWKDAAKFDEQEANYFNNFNKVLTSPQNNNFSIKIIYFLDYLSLKRKHI